MARDFDGIDDIITVSSPNSSLDNIFDGGGTLLIWTNPTSAGDANQGYVIDRNGKWRFQNENILSGDLNFTFVYLFSGTNGLWRSNDRPYSTNQWNPIIIRYNSDSITNDPDFFINGIKKEYTAVTAPTGTRTSDAGNDVNIGSNSALSRSFDGMIAEFAIWDIELTDVECFALNDGISPNRIRPSAMVGYWPLYGNSSPEPDLSGNGNNGTVTGTTKADHTPVQPYSAKNWGRILDSVGGSPPASSTRRGFCPAIIG